MDFNQIAALTPAQQFGKARVAPQLQFEGDRKLTDEEIREIIAASFRWPAERTLQGLERHRDLTARGLIAVAQNGWFSPKQISSFGRFGQSEEQIWSTPAVKNYQGLPSGRTRLMYAAKQGDVSTVRFLLQRGADVTLRDSDLRDALHYACFECDNVNDIEDDKQPWLVIARLLLNPYNPDYWPDQRVPPPSCQRANPISTKFSLFMYPEYALTSVRDEVVRMYQIHELPEIQETLFTDHEKHEIFRRIITPDVQERIPYEYFVKKASLLFLQHNLTQEEKLECLYVAVREYNEMVDPRLPKNEKYFSEEKCSLLMGVLAHFFDTSVFPTPFTTLILDNAVLHYVADDNPDPEGHLENAMSHVIPTQGLVECVRNIAKLQNQYDALTEEEKDSVKFGLYGVFQLCPNIVGGKYRYYLCNKFRPNDDKYHTYEENELFAPYADTLVELADASKNLWISDENARNVEINRLISGFNMHCRTLQAAFAIYKKDKVSFREEETSDSDSEVLERRITPDLQRRQRRDTTRFVKSFADENVYFPLLSGMKYVDFQHVDVGDNEEDDYYTWEELSIELEDKLLGSIQVLEDQLLY